MDLSIRLLNVHSLMITPISGSGSIQVPHNAGILKQKSVPLDDNMTDRPRDVICLFRLGDDPLILTLVDVVERALEMPLRILQAGCLLAALDVAVDQLDQAVEVFGRDLASVS